MRKGAPTSRRAFVTCEGAGRHGSMTRLTAARRDEEKGLMIVIASLVKIGESIDEGSNKLTPLQVAGIMLRVECLWYPAMTDSQL
jgi:hypothetical protein